MNYARQGIPLRADPDAIREQAMTNLTRAVIAAASAKLDPQTITSEFITRRWGIAAAADIVPVLRAASSPATTTNATWAGLWAQTVPAYLANLVPYSAGADLLQRGLVLRFDGANQISLPSVSMPLGDFVQQGQPIPVVSGTSSAGMNLNPCKFAVITVLTREIIESGNAEQLVRTALLESSGPSLDRRLFDNAAAVPDLRPAGLLNGKVALTPSADTNKIAAMVADLSSLAATVAPLAGNGGICFIAAAKQSVAINIGLPKDFAYPLLTSTTLSNGTIIAIAVNALVSALGGVPQIDESRVASMHTDTSPLPLASGGTMPSPVSVMFQTDKTALRLRWPIAWTLRDPAAIAFISAAAWP